MSYFADLTPYAYFPASPYCVQHDALNVGWLSKGAPFESGEVQDGFVAALRQLEVVNLCRGSHRCEFCEHSPGVLEREKAGNGEIRVTGADGTVYAAPVLIAHYVEAHGYRPPQAFIDAVMRA